MKLIVSFNLDNLLNLVMLAQKLIDTLMADHQFEKHVLCRYFWEVSFFFSFFFIKWSCCCCCFCFCLFLAAGLNFIEHQVRLKGQYHEPCLC